MARKFGTVELVIDGRALSFEGDIDVDPTVTDCEVEVMLDGTIVVQEMHKIAKISGTIQVPEGTGIVTHLASIRSQTCRVIVGHLEYMYPSVAVKTTGGVNAKGKVGIEIYPTSKPTEKVNS